MPLWGNIDYANGNNKPVWANTSNLTSNSTINGTAANGYNYYGSTMGVSASEQAAATAKHPQHAGWVSQKIGTGPIKSISILTAGAGINTDGFLIITDTSPWGKGANANISFTKANSLNSLQSFSTNSTQNVISTLTIVNGGDGFSANSQITVKTNGSNTVSPTFSIVLGGRGDRINYETLIAMGSITGDDPKDNAYFTGV